ncbi:dihydrolipoyl dehydrogenase family protein [Winogradskyella ursingii]|uniref:dihydrolipoyl dehydrogenase family protein n=1 Tax=Winogradskyella ursingii TaxID=2686079 RepID=UPI0015CDB6B3|nr:NAD(P)/FAD-dependent oxidoreductase [Winogradskyella ursingii]
MKTKHYDVFVIGSGIAGQTAAEISAKNGLSVAIADLRKFGGTCSLRGCDPKRILLQFSDLAQQSKQLQGLGVVEPPKIKWKSVQKFKSTFTKPVPLDTEKDLSDLGIDLYHQSPKFTNNDEIMVEGKKVSADKFVIATGLIPRELKIDGSDYLKTSDDILKLKKIPKSAIFLGSGYVGMEFCYMLSTMGCKCTMIEMSDKILAPFDAFLVQKLTNELKSRGVKFVLNAETTSVKKLKKNLRVTYNRKGKTKTKKARIVINSAGRIPAIEQLDLEKANIDADDSGVLVNNFMQSVSNKKIYAVGDVSSKSLPLTPLSGLQGYVAGNNILKENSKEFQNPLVPSVVFTQPQLAMVGYTEEEAKKRYKNVRIYSEDASDWYNAEKENTQAYAYKILVNERTQEIVGAHLLSPQANETINIFALAMNNNMTVGEFKKQIFTYPSFANDLKSMLKDEE